MRTKKTKEIVEKFVQMYQKGMSCLEIERQTGTWHNTIARWIKEAGVQMRSESEKNRRYPVDDHLFDQIDEAWKAYFCGYVWADGTLAKHEVVLQLSGIEDKPVLDFFNQKIYNGQKPLGVIDRKFVIQNGQKYNCKIAHRLCVANNQIKENLMKLGLHQDKSFTIDYPKFQGFEAAFIQGIFEADGCVGFYQRKYRNKLLTNAKLEILGSENLIFKINDILIKNNIHMKCGPRIGTNIFSIKSNSPTEIIKFYHFIYSSNSGFAMERKKKKFEQIIAYQQRLAIYNSIGYGGVYFDKNVRKIRLILDGKLIGYFDNTNEAMDRKIDLINRHQ